MNPRKMLADCIREWRKASGRVAQVTGDKRKMRARNRETRCVALRMFGQVSRSIRGLSFAPTVTA